jgi:pimeloyl-ACP methyl ester carboxylesterase
MKHLGIDKAHVVGLSMGGFASLHFGLRHAVHALSLVVAGVGYGAEKDQQAKFRVKVEVVAKSLLSEGMPAFAENMLTARRAFSSRTRTRAASPSSRRARRALGARLGQHPDRVPGPAAVALRPGRGYAQDDHADPDPDRRRGLAVSRALGDDEARDPDGGAGGDAELRPHRQSRGSRPVQPIVGDFIVQVQAGRWPKRDPRAMSTSITGDEDLSRRLTL